MTSGSFLRSNFPVYVVVVYTGNDCKVWSSRPVVHQKPSKIEQFASKLNFWLMIIALCLSVLFSIISFIIVLATKKSISSWFLSEHQNMFINLFTVAAGWLIIFSRLVPIHLSTAFTIAKYYQGQSLRTGLKEDCDIQVNKRKGYPRKLPRNNVLNQNCLEDLGSVDLVLLERAGSLTLKDAVIEKMRCANQLYDENFEEEKELKSIRNENLVKNISQNSDIGFKTREILRCMAVCNTTEFVPGNVTGFTGTSVDEIANCKYAKKYGAEFLNTQERSVIKIINESFGSVDDDNGLVQQRNYHIISYFAHQPFLERSSILVYVNGEDNRNKLIVYTKGSINGFQNIINRDTNSEFEIGVAKLKKDRESGFQIQMFARREFDMDDFLKMLKNVDENINTTINTMKKIESLQYIMKKLTADNFLKVRGELESDLEFLGSTCSKERLDYQLRQTFSIMKAANIATWIVSNDPLESCIFTYRRIGLVGSISPVKIVLNLQYVDDVSIANLESLKNKISKVNDKGYCLGVSGECLERLLTYEGGNEVAFDNFLNILFKAEFVAFGDMNPVHKLSLVHMVKKHRPERTMLAIGDTAEDEPMLVSAHIGIALFREKQYLTCRSSDLFMQKFHQIKELIFVHGENISRKNSKILLFCLYTSLLLTIPEILTAPLSYFFPRRLLPDWISSTLCLVFPLFFLAVFANNDRIFQREEKLKFVDFYENSRQG